MNVQAKRFSWFRQPTGWEQTQRWQTRRSAMRQDFDLANRALSNGIFTAASNVIEGTATLAGQQALSRIQAETKVKAASTDLTL
jgi:hypothetical protein